MTRTASLEVDAPQLGRRERKKAQTRATIATAALELFLDRGFDEVGIREVAAQADVAVATVFAHFPSKEALVFDEDEEIIAALVASVTDRADGVSPLQAMEDWFVRTDAAQQQRKESKEFAEYRALVDRTPALQAYWQNSWRRHQKVLASALLSSSSMNGPTAELLATFVIEGFLLAADHQDTADRLHLLFRTLRSGIKDA